MNIAILIDAENVLPGHADLIFSHAQTRGTIVRREIYGAASALSSWVAPVLKYAIHPNLTIKAAKGKNSSDIALVIGAMDLLVAGGIDCAIIVSSDSDFSALSVRMRNAGIEVVGMGTDKANALWRTACSSFVVLQNQKPAQPVKKPQPPKPVQSAKPAQPARKAEEPPKQNGTDKAPAAGSHGQRAAVIEQKIRQVLESHGGRVQVSTLFPALNKLSEYRTDRMDSGRRPKNYLTSTFGDAFRFEETPDGKSWVSLPGVAPDAGQSTPVQAEAEAPEAVIAPEAAAAPEALDVVAPADAGQPAGDVAIEAAATVEPAAGEAEGYVTPQQIIDRLVAGGFDEDIARQVTDIFADSTSYRSAYNKLRSVFGNNEGREYYQSAKRILTDRAE